MSLEKIKEYILVIIMFCILAVVIVVLSLCEAREKEEANAILNNPSFVGEIIGRDIRHTRGMTFMSGFSQYRLHIVGELIEDNETVQIDRIFIVSSELFNRFDKGDVISYYTFRY